MGKKKFIDKKKAATFEMCPRDTSDPRYSDAPGGDKIFLRVDQNPVNITGFAEEEEDNSRFDDAPEELAYGYSGFSESSNSLPAHVRKEILELGYPDDGYNYLAHLREIKNTGGGSNFYANPKFEVDHLPRDIKAYDASRVKVSGVVNEEANDDKYMYTVASKTLTVKVQKAIDPEVAALLENSDVSEFGSDVEDLEEDFVVQANLAQHGETSGVSNSESQFPQRPVGRDRETVGFTDKPVPVAENSRAPRQIDELFDQLELNEYGSDSDNDGGYDGGYISEDGEEDKFMAQNMNIENLLIHEKPKDYELDEKYMNPADILKNSDSVKDKEELDSAAHIIRRTVEYGENFENGDEEFVDLVEESSDESEKYDCETIISTRSNLDNHPGKIYAPGTARRKKLSETVANAMNSNGKFIALEGKERLPVEFLPGRKAEQTGVKPAIPKAEPIKRKTHGQESKEEKKERKNAVKTEKREARKMKKETKELYRGETQRAQRAVAVSGPSTIPLSRISSHEIPSDISVHVGETSFSLHKLPLVSKCGLLKKLASESNNDSKVTDIKIPDFPGGAQAFELAIKFCYDINSEINTENIVMVRCAAEHLEMTEEHSVANLVETTETYFNTVVLKSLPNSVMVLQKSEDLLPIAERVKLVSRCIDSIAYITFQESQSRVDIVDCWAEELAVLRIHMFQRVFIAMMARGFKRCALAPVLILYAQKALGGLEFFGKGRKKMEAKQEHEKRVIVETIVSLLPQERNTMSVSFLSMLLRAAIYLETTVACRLDLEKRMGLELRQAVLNDLLIPSYSYNGGNTKFDVDTVQRILMNHLEFEVEQSSIDFASDIGELMDSYLAEIASDRNLNMAKFMGLAECIPEQSRITDDGLYRAIDIYLKAHPNTSKVEKKKVCSIMDCQKLSRKASAHATQNERLPVQTVVQLLHYEQQSIRQVLSDSDSSAATITSDIYPPPKISSYSDELSKLNRENQDLKLELLKAKMKLKELEKDKAIQVTSGSDCSSVSTPSVVRRPPLPRKSFMNSVSRQFARFNPFGSTQGRIKPPTGRRHSLS